MTSTDGEISMRRFVGMVDVGKEDGTYSRVEVDARSPDEARIMLEETYGIGKVFSVDGGIKFVFP